MRGASGTTPLTVKQIADAHQSGTGDKGAPFVVDGVDTANVMCLFTLVVAASCSCGLSNQFGDSGGFCRLDSWGW
jgi:replication factor A2